MHLRSRFAITSALLLLPSLALAAEGTFDRTLNVSGATYLSVATGSGNIHLSPGSDSQVHIKGHVKSGSRSNWPLGGGSLEEQVREIVDHPPIEQQGSSIKIGRHTERLNNISIDYDITLPAGGEVEATSGSGDVRVERISGGVKVETGSGGIEASEIGGLVSLETGSGDIRAGLANARDVKAHTGSGNLRLGNVQGPLRADTGSGNIDISGKPSSSWKLEAGSGSVTLNTGQSHFTLDAETGSGDVHSDPPLLTHGSQEHGHISGDVNGGGPMVRIETGSGDIAIH